MTPPQSVLRALALLLVVGAAAATLGPSQAMAQEAAPSRVFWRERFDGPTLDWVDPFKHDVALLRSVYRRERDERGPGAFLHARHDARGRDYPPAMHYGRAFQNVRIPLERVKALTWRWRVRQHPNAPRDDAWLDVAAGVYVIMKTPSVLTGGRGFKFGWLAHPGERGTHQHGLLQVPLRNEGAGPAWRAESVDLCGLFRREYGRPCEGENVLYVGVVTDGDNTRSVADADYADFELVAAS